MPEERLNWIDDWTAAGARLAADLGAAVDDAMLVLGQTGRAWQQEEVTGGRAGLGRIEELYSTATAQSLEQPLAEWRRRKPVQQALEAFQRYESAAGEVVDRLPGVESITREQARTRIAALAPSHGWAPRQAWIAWRWWLNRRKSATVPVHALAQRFLNTAISRRSRLDGEIQLILAQAGLLITDAWESDRRRTLSQLAGHDAIPRAQERAQWAGRARKLQERAAAALARYGEWNHNIPASAALAVYSGVTAVAPQKGEADGRASLLDYWARQQRAVQAFLDLESAVAVLGAECCHESRRALEALAAEHDQLRRELDEMAEWLHAGQMGSMPIQHARLRSAEERVEAWLAGYSQKVRARLPAMVEVTNPRTALPPRLHHPWRSVKPLALFQTSLQESARPEALEGFRAAEGAHREIVREVERAREVVAFGEEARADGDAEGAEIAREAATNAAQLLDHLRATLQDVRPAAERGLVRGQAASLLDFHVAIDEGRLGLWTHLTRQRGLRAWREWAGWGVAKARSGVRHLRRYLQDGFEWLLQAVGWTPPPRPRLEPVVEHVDLHRLFQLGPRPAGLPRLYRRLFRHEPVEDPRFLIGREGELAGFASAVAAFQEHRRTSVVIVGARGSGKTSLLNCALTGVPAGIPVHRSQFGARLSTASAMREFLCSLLGLPDGADPRDALASGRRLVVLEELERAYIASMGGFAALRELMSIVEATAGTTLWVFSINESAFAYLDSVLGLGRVFPLRINAMSVSPSDLRRAILYRHHLSALRLQFTPSGPSGPATSARRWLGIEDDPRDVFFDALHDRSEGVFRSALHLWEESIERVDGGVVSVRRPNNPEFDKLMAGLDRTDSFALVSILRHGGLTVSELQRILPDPRVDWQARCDRLEAMGLLEPDPAQAGLRVASLAARAVREMLRRQNLE